MCAFFIIAIARSKVRLVSLAVTFCEHILMNFTKGMTEFILPNWLNLWLRRKLVINISSMMLSETGKKVKYSFKKPSYYTYLSFNQNIGCSS